MAYLIMNIPEQVPAINKSESWKMFNDISPQYDFLNHLLSLGLDMKWRKRLTQLAPQKENLSVLDLATGTADLLISFVKNNPRLKEGYGIDLAYKMLKLGRRKIEQLGLSDCLKLSEGDITKINFPEKSFDVVSIAFGIRNVENPANVLSEMYRVLKQDGRALILEFSLPANPVIRKFHLFYLRKVVPVVGGILSGNHRAYKYLNETIEAFPYGKKFCGFLEKAGFTNVKAHPLFYGIATIYQGDKKE